MKKKVLFITNYFPPVLCPESIQSSRYVKYLRTWNWEPSVLCEDCRTQSHIFMDMSLRSLIPSEVNIYSVKSLGTPYLGKLIGYGSVCLPGCACLPDHTIGWYLPAVKRGLSLINKNEVDVIHSRSMMLTSSLVGLKLKKETGIPWISYFSDPWIDNPYLHLGFFSKYINSKWERSVMEHSDAIIFTSEETRLMVMKKYSKKIQDKCHVIPHCFDPDLINQISTVSTNEKTKFTITFTGNFYGPRTPVGLFIALKNMLQKNNTLDQYINIQIVGSLPKKYKTIINKLHLEKIISVIDTVPYIESIKYMKNADVLLLIDAPSKSPSIFLPVKLIDYMGFQKSILGLTPLEGESATLIRKLNGYVVSPEDIPGIECAILHLYEKFKNGKLSDVSYSDNNIALFNANTTSKKLADLFEMVSK